MKDPVTTGPWRLLGIATLAAATAWVALCSWHGLVESPQRFLMPALVCAGVVAVLGAGLRAVRTPWPLVPVVQVLACGVYLAHRYAAGLSLGGWVPTPASVQRLGERAAAGMDELNRYVAPVSNLQRDTYLYLLLGCVLILVAVDLLACGLRRIPLASLPLLLALAIPVAVLDSGLSWVVFVTTALLFFGLLATEETQRVRGWGRTIPRHDQDGHVRADRWDSLDQVVNGGSVRAAAVRIGLIATAGALVVPLFVPVAGDIFGLRKGLGSTGLGAGSSGGTQLVSPLVDLRRDLARGADVPLVYATTRTTDAPSYVRLTVLDEFDGDAWRPSERDLDSDSRVDGVLPTVPGLASDTPGSSQSYDFRLARNYQTPWLPLPYPATSVKVDGDWRYDPATFDVASADSDVSTGGLIYSATGFTPQVRATQLDDALSAPGDVLVPNTRLPRGLPAVISRTALQVTRGADSDFRRAVALQNWFRDSGGFTYSLDPGPGSGMAQLARFVTTDKVGYCEQFAAAMAVMGRSLGIPSRVAVGFLRPQQQSARSFVFSTHDLHAWPEMYFAGAGWVRFEPTPATHTGDSPAYTRATLPSQAPSSAAPTARPSNARPSPAPQDSATPQDRGPASSGSGLPGWLPVLVLLLLLGLALALPRLLRDARRRRWLAGGATSPDGEAVSLAEGAWAELRATTRDLALGWPEGRSVRETGRALVREVRPDAEALAALEALVGFVERARYDRVFTLDAGDRERVRADLARWEHAARRAAPRSRARLSRVFPVSGLLSLRPSRRPSRRPSPGRPSGQPDQAPVDQDEHERV